MKAFRYLYIFGLLLLAACQSDDLPYNPDSKAEFVSIVGDKVVVNIGVDAQQMSEVQSRALGQNPDYNDMQLCIVEFDDNGTPRRNNLRRIYTPDSETPQTDRVLYKVTLDKSDQPRILHFVVVPKDIKLDIQQGLEATVMPSLTTTGGTPAYWRRLSFPDGYVRTGADGKEFTTPELGQLQHVALVRNHACISMTNNTPQTDNTPDFILSGFAVVNNPTSGTIVPFNTTSGLFPDMLDASQNVVSFDNLRAQYSGLAPMALQFSNQEAGPVVPDDVAPKYIYERPFSSIRHTYVIIKGRRKQDTQDTYYKLDLGANDSRGIFQYYPLLRNFNFNVRLNKVDAQGYKTPLAAAQGVVFNNFSFDIELRSMLNISDGSEVVYVNFTTAVLTSSAEETIEFKYRYRDLTSTSPTYNNGNVNFVDLEQGDVIKSVDKSDQDDAEGWRVVKITCYGATTEAKTQSFTIVKPETGLGRTITLVLHNKWPLTNQRIFGGTMENWSASTPNNGIVGPEIGDDLTLFFDIPDNLPEAMFPLVFTLEADRQNIENNPIGKLVVTSGTSGFSGVSGRRIKYEKNVSWAEYNDALNPTDPEDNGTAIDNGNGTFTHRVRCRFRTTTSLDVLGVSETTTRILVTNPNFDNATITFDRQR